jgi:hypothetical protein
MCHNWSRLNQNIGKEGKNARKNARKKERKREILLNKASTKGEVHFTK